MKNACFCLIVSLYFSFVSLLTINVRTARAVAKSPQRLRDIHKRALESNQFLKPDQSFQSLLERSQRKLLPREELQEEVKGCGGGLFEQATCQQGRESLRSDLQRPSEQTAKEQLRKSGFHKRAFLQGTSKYFQDQVYNHSSPEAASPLASSLSNQSFVDGYFLLNSYQSSTPSCTSSTNTQLIDIYSIQLNSCIQIINISQPYSVFFSHLTISPYYERWQSTGQIINNSYYQVLVTAYEDALCNVSLPIFNSNNSTFLVLHLPINCTRIPSQIISGQGDDFFLKDDIFYDNSYYYYYGDSDVLPYFGFYSFSSALPVFSSQGSEGAEGGGSYLQ